MEQPLCIYPWYPVLKGSVFKDPEFEPGSLSDDAQDNLKSGNEPFCKYTCISNLQVLYAITYNHRVKGVDVCARTGQNFPDQDSFEGPSERPDHYGYFPKPENEQELGIKVS